MKCPHCGREGYAPSNTYPSAEGFVPSEGAITRLWRFAKTGEFRTPAKGEWYLSGAIPEAYCARSALSERYHILRRVL